MGRGSSGASVEYGRIPVSVRMYGASRAPAEDRAAARRIVTSFISNAKAGDVYRASGGIGSQGGTFEIVSYKRSPNGLGIRAGNRTVAMTRENVMGFIGNGVRREKKRR